MRNERTVVPSSLEKFVSVICFCIPYANSYSSIPAPLGYGRVARFAWGRDYHIVVKNKVKACLEDILQALGFSRSSDYQVLLDSSPILEKAIAVQADSMFRGKNSLVINKTMGSYVILAEAFLSVELESCNRKKPEQDVSCTCSSCSKCVSCCPSSAILNDYCIDATKCISYLTIEKKGILNQMEQQMIGDWLFGCDICQKICPCNSSTHSFCIDFDSFNGAGRFISLCQVLKLSNRKDFEAYFSNSAFHRTGRVRLLRNACCICANTKFMRAIESLKVLASEDKSEVLRGQAKQSLEYLFNFADGLDRLRICTFLS